LAKRFSLTLRYVHQNITLGDDFEVLMARGIRALLCAKAAFFGDAASHRAGIIRVPQLDRDLFAFRWGASCEKTDLRRTNR
jgi:hypothetical protein